MLQGLKCVDAVWTFDSEEDLERICEMYQPNVMVKGKDYEGKRIVGAKHCKEIKFVELVDGYSTTNIIQRIADR
jgi:D-beta-D-heptose 7-phosphate kinase/D-beta-D-heptose 1-phosphate adenosyltransferase